MALKASEAKKQGDLLSALDHHTQAAKLYKDIALAIRDKNRKCEAPRLLENFHLLPTLCIPE